MVGFDVLNEPWIPVIALDGTSRELGILGVLLEAHRLSEVVCESPLETYAVQRFLIAFLMDAYRLPRAGDRRKLFESGCFDEKVISDYIELCRSEGVTFDLFDKERPFYQAVFDEQKDGGKIKPISYLFHAAPSGINHIHFEHTSIEKASPSEAFLAMLALQTYTASGGRGYYRSLNQDPCWYVLLRGKNLFETLCLSMLSKGECRELNYDPARHIWGETEKEKQDKQYVDVSLLDGLTFRSRRIALIRENDESIRQVYYEQGELFQQQGRWLDPHVTYIKGKDDYYPLVPIPNKMIWRDVGAFTFSNDDEYSRPASIIKSSANIIKENTPRIIMLFGIALNKPGKAKFVEWMSDQIRIPGELLFDEEKAGFLRATMNDIEQAAALVYHTVNSAANAMEHTKDGRKKEKEAAKEAETVFFAEMHTALFAEYFPVLAEADKTAAEWERKPVEVINGCIQRAAKHVVEDYVKKLGDTAKCIEVQTNTLRFFRAQLFKILNGRKVRK